MGVLNNKKSFHHFEISEILINQEKYKALKVDVVSLLYNQIFI